MAYSHHLTTERDQSYSCHNEECTNYDIPGLDLDADLDPDTWTCNACGQAVLIELLDQAGTLHYVRRTQAKHIKPGDFIYLNNDLVECIQVKGSNRAKSKHHAWYLGLENIGARFVEPDCYFHCIP